MKKKFALILLSFLLFSGCDLVNKVEDLTETANNLLQTINSIAQQIDTKVETGDLTRELGFLIDERLSSLSEEIDGIIQSSGGFVFDEVNGTIDNVFDNISTLLDQIQTGILEETLPMLIDQISSEIQMNINLLSSSIEDLVILTFGNVFILVDKTVNSVVIFSSIGLLAIGLIIFIITLFRKDRKLTLFRGIGLSFMAIYLVFFSLLIFSNKTRGNIIAGLDFAVKYEGAQLSPKITSVSPNTFTFGDNDKIFLYGKHLNLIDTIGVVLKINDNIEYTFPSENIIVNTQNKIVLGNFSSWSTPKFAQFKRFLNAADVQLVNSTAYKEFAYDVAVALNPQTIVTPAPAVPAPFHSREVFRARTSINKNITEIKGIRKNSAYQKFNPVQADHIIMKIDQFYNQYFQLPEGDYGISVLSANTEVPSSQFLTIAYPEPPAPLPDIYPTDIYWTGATPVSGQNTTLNVKLGFRHPEEISRNFKVNLTSSALARPLEITIPMGTIASAQTSNQAVVTTNSFALQNSGNYTFKAVVDEPNDIIEKDENNNTHYKQLQVKRYVYDLTINYSTFESKSNEDDPPGSEDEYRLDFRSSVTGHSAWTFDYNKDGEPGNLYSINQSKKYTNLLPGSMYTFYVTCKEADSGLKGADDYMGEVLQVHYLNTDIHSMSQNTVQYPISLEPGNHKYKITGTYTITRRIL